MAELRAAAPVRVGLIPYGAYLGIGLAILAVVLLGAGPLGWRAGWWHYRFAFSWLMTASAYVAVAAAITSLFTLALGWPQLDRRTMTVAALGLALGAGVAYVPWHYNHVGRTVPRINDISTDTVNPPGYVAVLRARAAEQSNSVTYGGLDVAQRQKAAYPDVVPLIVALAPAEAFRRAQQAAERMSGWTIVAADAASGRIEASHASLWFGFIDDIVIRITAERTGSRIDVRSMSRHGRSDYGVNARRIRSYLAELRQRAS
jgi:uncharacterized protein (DUF1499 family)